MGEGVRGCGSLLSHVFFVSNDSEVLTRIVKKMR